MLLLPPTEACNTVAAQQSELTAGNATRAVQCGPRVLPEGRDAGRWVNAWDEMTGEAVWKQRLNAPICGYPITCELDGEQYLVMPTGLSAAGASIAAAFPERQVPSGAGNSIFAFTLRKS